MIYKRYGKTWLLAVLLLGLFFPTVSSGKMLVGAILTGNIPYYMSMHEALADELQKKAPAGEEITFALQRPFPDPVAWSNAARKLIVGGADLIISYGYPATDAVLAKDSKIPIVYVGVYNPDAAVHGNNITGIGYKVSLSNLLEYYKQVVKIKRLCVIYSQNEGDSVSQMKEIAELAEQQQVNLLKMNISSHKDLKVLRDTGIGDAIYFTGSTQAHVWIKDILAFLRKRKIPVVDIFPHPKDDGVLITLYQDPEQLGRRGADLVAKVIAGEQAGNIEHVVAEDAKLVINQTEAGILGVSVPDQMIGEAAEVIK